MDTKDILLKLRMDKGFSQDQLAEKVYVTRQAVSRWENGETTPNTETLKLLSKLYDISINTLLGAPRQLICQCCGMPLEDGIISRESDGMFNEDYCKWCYADGKYAYENIDDLIEFCAEHMPDAKLSPQQLRASIRDSLMTLSYWKKYSAIGGEEKFDEFKQQLIEEINALHIDGMPSLESLSVLHGKDANHEYSLPGGKTIRLLDDDASYLGNQLECIFGGSRCFGIIASMDFILICTHEENGANPELLIYKKR